MRISALLYADSLALMQCFDVILTSYRKAFEFYAIGKIDHDNLEIKFNKNSA